MSKLGYNCDACGTPMESGHTKCGDLVEVCPTCDSGNRMKMDTAPHNGAAESEKLERENKRLREVLLQCEEYFDLRADADCVGDPARLVGNEEMYLLRDVREVLK